MARRWLRRLKDLIAYGFRSLIWLLRSLFGAVRWQPPPWLSLILAGFAALGRRSSRVRRERPRAFYGAVLAILVIGGGGYGGWRYYESLPKPERFSVSANAPGITPLRQDAVPDPVTITFGGSAAPLEAVGKPVTQGITMTPPLKGAWTWTNDSSLTFTLAQGEDWGVGVDYTVTLDKTMFPRHVLLETYEVKFSSGAFSVGIDNGEFYTDPKDPKVKRVLATIKASHPLDAETLKTHVHLKKKVLKKGELTLNGETVPFTVTFDKFMGEAYVVSENIPVPLDEFTVAVTVDAGVKSSRGGKETENELTRDVRVPGMYDYFRINNATATFVRNDRYEPEQVLIIETSAPALQEALQKHLTVWQLPADRPASPGRKAQKNHRWSANEVGPEILGLGTKVELTAIPTEKEYDTLHSFRYKGDIGRYLFVRIEKGIKSYGDYVLAKTFEDTARNPELPREVTIMHQGSILSLTGQQKISVVARDVPAVRFEVGRVLPGELNHLITQTAGTFQQPTFQSYSFKEDNITEKFEEVRPLAEVEKGKAQYTYFDFAKYAQAGAERRGLFFLKADGWDAERQRSLGVEDKRFILVTDLGVVVKKAAGGGSDVFVMSIRTGKAVAGARVDVLGKNGISVAAAATDVDGHARLPDLKDFKNEKEPVVYLVAQGRDLSFLPYSRYDRMLNLSRFDVGGEATEQKEGALMAYLFSDRGIYRPGDTFHVGMIVKDTRWARDLTGVPLEAIVTDARGLVVKKERLALDAEGFLETAYTTTDTSPTGDYQVSLYVIREDGKTRDFLGTTSVRVEEFLPDRLRISARFSLMRGDGWVNPKDLKGEVSLKNLFGTPAAGHRVTGAIKLVPWAPAFRQFKDYVFFDPKKAKSSFSESVKEQKTDDKGEAEFDLELNRFADATYRLTFLANGFELEGGRGVAAQSSILVSPDPWLIGWKTDGDLRYIKRGAGRSATVVAVDPELKQVAVPGLKAHLVELKYVSVLTKQPSGVYKYESVRKEVTVSTAKLEISAAGDRLPLKTDKAGDFALIIRDGDDRELNRIEYSVAGQANLSRSLERNAELQVKLAKADYAPGETIDLEIVAPYTGAGLITIEKDRVYAYKWFNATTTASVQQITVPADLEGNGYVNVAFVRDIASPEIFMSPLSYGVVPFSVSRDRRIDDVSLGIADVAKPGEPFTIKFKTKKPSKIAIVAVDEGILQVARYQTPDPLAAFFKKKALQVTTAQILDLILPEFDLVKSLAAPGGDGEGALAANLNPFKRKREKPVAFWSGIIDAGPDERQVVYDVPDYFNGTLRVFAVAVATDAIGVKKTQAIIRGPFVINPNVPTFLAPGDETTVTASVANLVEGSGDKAKIHLELAVGPGLRLLDGGARDLEIQEGKEGAFQFKVKATDALGDADLKFQASLGDRRVKYATDLSVRPAAPYRTTVRSGTLHDETLDVPVTRTMYKEYRTLEAAGSAAPIGLARGLMAYLDKYPYGCTEQLVSKAFPVLVLRAYPEFGFDAKAVQSRLDEALGILRSRQNGEGAFGFWAANSSVSDFQVAYATHFLTEAKERGLPVPPDMLQRALGYLLDLLNTQPTDLPTAREHAYALYVVTRNGVVSTNQLDALVSQLKEKFADDWQQDLIGIYVAATYQLLKQEGEAAKLIDKAEFGAAVKADYAYFYDSLVRDSQLLYILAKHFPARMQKLSGKELEAIVKPIVAGQFNTLSSSFAILAFDAYAQAAAQAGMKALSIAEILADKKERQLSLGGDLIRVADFSGDATALRYKTEGGGALFWQVTEAGFDKALPSQAMTNKVEVQREYRDAKGAVVAKAKVGDELEVHLKVRATQGHRWDHVAIVDLLPAGFEIELNKAPVAAPANDGGGGGGEDGGQPADGGGASDAGGNDGGNGAGAAARVDAGGSSWSPDYVDVREDRIVLFGSIGDGVSEFVYKVRATNQGGFQVPPIFAESMYDRSLQALSLGSSMAVDPP